MQLPPLCACVCTRPSLPLPYRAAKAGLSCTLMERLLHPFPNPTPSPTPQLSYMLRMQYRMHETIVQWPSEALYNRALLSHHSVKKHLLRWAGLRVGGVEGGGVEGRLGRRWAVCHGGRG